MLNISPGLRQPCRSLAEIREAVLAQIEALNERIHIWSLAIEHANGEGAGSLLPAEHDTLGMAIDHASDELARLEQRLDALDDELGNLRDDDPGRPLVL